jgi:hypothetical protein
MSSAASTLANYNEQVVRMTVSGVDIANKQTRMLKKILGEWV